MTEEQFLDLYKDTSLDTSPQLFYKKMLKFYIGWRDYWYDAGFDRMYKEAKKIILDK